jgi:hypothetical protein
MGMLPDKTKKKIVIYPEINLERGIHLAQTFIHDYGWNPKKQGFNHGVIYAYPGFKKSYYVYQTKTSVIVRKNSWEDND